MTERMQQVTLPDGTVVEVPESVLLEAPAPSSSPKQAVLDTIGEAGLVADKVVRGGVFALPRTLKAIDQYAFGDSPKAASYFQFGPEPAFKTPEDAPINKLKGFSDWLTTPSEPETAVGKAIGNIGETALGTVFFPGGGLTQPARLGTSLKVGLGTGAGAEAAGQVFDDNPVARILGAVLGGGATSLYLAAKPNSTELVRQATRGVTDTGFNKAASVERDLADAGIPAIKSQLLGDRSALDDLVQAGSARLGSRPELLEATRRVPERSARALDLFMKRYISLGMKDTRTVLSDVQGTADDAIRAVKETRSDLWKSTYDSTLRALREKAEKELTAIEGQLSHAQKVHTKLQVDYQLKLAAAQQTDDAIRAAYEKAIAPKAPVERPTLPMGSGSKNGRLLTAAEQGDEISKKLAGAEGAQAVAGGKTSLLGPDGRPMDLSPRLPKEPVPTVVPKPEELTQAEGQIAALQAQKTAAVNKLDTVGDVPSNLLEKEYSRLTRLAASKGDPAEQRAILELRDRLKPDGKFLTDGQKLYESLRGMSNSLKAQTQSANPIDAGLAKYLQWQIRLLHGTFGESFTPYKAANQKYAQFSEDVVQPVQKGLAGQLATMGGGVKPDKFTAKSTAINIVFPKDMAQPADILKLGDDIGSDAVADLLKEHLSRSMESAIRSARSSGTPGAAASAPFKFVNEVAGSPAQRKNLDAALQVIAKGSGANPQEIRRGFYKLLRAMETTKHLKLSPSVDRAAVGFKAGENLPGVMLALQSRYTRFTWEHMTEKTFREITDMMLAPDGLKQIQAIARTEDPAIAKAFARSILSATQVETEYEKNAAP